MGFKKTNPRKRNGRKRREKADQDVGIIGGSGTGDIDTGGVAVLARQGNVRGGGYVDRDFDRVGHSVFVYYRVFAGRGDGNVV
jgi:hypothetical protein